MFVVEDGVDIVYAKTVLASTVGSYSLTSLGGLEEKSRAAFPRLTGYLAASDSLSLDAPDNASFVFEPAECTVCVRAAVAARGYLFRGARRDKVGSPATIQRSA